MSISDFLRTKLFIQYLKKNRIVKSKHVKKKFGLCRVNERDQSYEMVNFSTSFSTQKMPPFNATVA